MSVAISGISPLPPAASTHATPVEDSKSVAAAQEVTPQISTEVTITNPNGSTTTTITYDNGTITTTNEPAPAGPQAAANGDHPAAATQGGLLDDENVAQTATLLAAQEKASAGT
jgi:hypothetical protein